MDEAPDVESSTDEYASRFAGKAGEYLLDVQNHAVMQLAQTGSGGRALDVGGGHAQLCGPLLQAGYTVTVVGSAVSCFYRVRRDFGSCVTCVGGHLLELPFQDRSFDLVVAIRMLAHISDTQRFIAALCRVARRAVIVDYPDAWSINAVTPLLYAAKKRVEGNTRKYRLYRRGDIIHLFEKQGFAEPQAIGQFFWPMVLHRMVAQPALSNALETIPKAFGLNRVFSSPMILRMVRT